MKTFFTKHVGTSAIGVRYLSTLPTIKIECIKLNTITKHANTIKKNLDQHGFVIFDGLWCEKTQLLDIAPYFGLIQGNKNTDKNGITVVSSRTDGFDSTIPGVYSNMNFSPHTDGAYLDGLREENGIIKKVISPKLTLLKCLQSSDSGGETMLIDGKKSLLKAINEYPDIVPALFRHDSIYLSYEDILTMNQALFRMKPNGKLRLHYSYDNGFIIANWAKKAIDLFNKKCLDITYSFKLKKGQILVVDNHRMLHARTAFKGQRILQRIWIQDDFVNEALFERAMPKNRTYFSHRDKQRNALSAYRRYGALSSHKKPYPLDLDSGIYLSDHEKKELTNILFHNQKLDSIINLTHI